MKFFPPRLRHQAGGLVFPALALSWCLLPLAAGLAAGDASPRKELPPKPAATEPGGAPKPVDPAKMRLQPALISSSAKEGGIISVNPQEPSKLLGGVQLGYEEILVLCDHVDYWQSKLPGLKRAVLDHALIASGPGAEDPTRVVFDSRNTKLPQISFRGLMRPRDVEIIRQPLAPEDQARLAERHARDQARKSSTTPADTTAAETPVLVRFRVLLHNVGDFAGDLKTTNGWAPHFGWADEAEVTVVCDLLPDGLANPRFSTIDLKGRPAGAGVDKRPARLGRKRIPLEGEAVQKEFDANAYDWWGESSQMTIEFDDQGRVLRIKTGADYRGEGTPSLDTPVQTMDS